ncbi:hypothetical protein SLA2020_009410 [Shorea laevis]
MKSNGSFHKIVKFQDFQKKCQDKDIPSPATPMALTARWSRGTKLLVRRCREIAHPSVEEGKAEEESSGVESFCWIGPRKWPNIFRL